MIKEVYTLSKAFPDDEKFGMVSQIRRACVSVNCNVAEGSSRHSGKDQARFTEIAYGSLLEVLNLLLIASDLSYVKEEEVDRLRPMVEELSNKLNALRNAQLRR